MIRRMMIVAAAAVAVVACADLQQPAPRQTMEVTLHEGATARVRETRRILLENSAAPPTVAFRQGDARIVPGSLQLVPPDGLVIQRRSIPTGMSDGLVWELSGQMKSDEPLTIAYELDGLNWTSRYTLTFRTGEGASSLRADMQLSNESHLDLHNASVSVNLVPAGSSESPDYPPEMHVHPPKLDLPDGWTKTVQLRTVNSPNLLAHIPSRVVYRYDPQEHPDAVHRLLELTDVHDGGDRPFMIAMPKGPMSVYVVNDGQGGDIPVATTTLDFSESAQDNADGPLMVDLGAFRDVSVQREKLKMDRTNLEFDRLGRVSGSDVIETWRLVAHNGTRAQVRVQMRQSLLENWELSSDTDPLMLDDYTAQWVVEIGPRASKNITYTITRHEGSRAED